MPENVTPSKINGKSQPAGAGSQVSFNTNNLKSSYCNVCNGSSTQEEVVINFGVNESWDMNKSKIEVDLHHRVVMSPHAAKRLADMMNRLIEEHEARYGKLQS
ncbi:DUF3467 domain-containing protein [Pseudooceanicola sp.]|uniref:DUF3467 domain-containing protein n=1 Tax=Pseudooceanicola sp. TaxID=1914328 RepID=UPI000C09EFE0|nr:hypothetical protein [Pseudooceanicola sp.]|tara:strand:- start:6606 stop:6914 length:309 start_codon:yes stop_codon:yes gene_type:complete